MVNKLVSQINVIGFDHSDFIAILALYQTRISLAKTNIFYDLTTSWYKFLNVFLELYY